jgi:hypothetical protein
MKDLEIIIFDEVVDENEFHFQVEIHQPYGVLDDVLAWARENITGRWAWRLISASNRATDGRYRFYFDTESDATIFTLRWA